MVAETGTHVHSRPSVVRSDPGRIFADHAERYTAIGWHVFPLAPLAKAPLIRGGRGFRDASRDSSIIAAWRDEFPMANIGVMCGGPNRLVVIDVDPRRRGDDELLELADMGFAFPHCPEQKTGNNGRHLVFRLPEDIRLSKWKLGHGIDIKGEGGYIVAAPSITGSSDAGPGGCYKWLVAPWEADTPVLPQWAIEKLTATPPNLVCLHHGNSGSSANRRLKGLVEKVAAAPEGSRNHLLNWASFIAAGMVRDGLLEGALVTSALHEAALAAGLRGREVEATIASAFRAAEKGGA